MSRMKIVSAVMFFVKISSILLQLSYVIAQSPQDTCLLTNNGNRLPSFSDRGYPNEGRPGRRIQHRNQAIIPSYKLDCCGNITEWGVDLNPDGTAARFDFTFQVWRPAPNVNITGCYSLVDDFISTGIPIGIAPSQTVNVARITPSLADQLQFQPGDVLGFYVESHGEGSAPGDDPNNGVALLTSGGYANELVWYGNIRGDTVQASRTGSCPYQTGTSGILSLSTRAAPVISISTTSYSCRQILSTTVVSSSFTSSPPLSIQPSFSLSFTSTLSAASNIRIPSSTTPTMVNVPGSAAYPIALISGVIAALIVVCVSTIAVATVITVVLAKQRRKIVTLARDQTNSGIVLSNQIYGAPMVHTNTMYVNNKPVSEENQTTYAESVQYHLVGPDTFKQRPSHTCTGDDLQESRNYATVGMAGMDTQCCTYENLNTKNQEAIPYEVPREVFDATGLYVPTAEERSKLGTQGHEMQGQNSNTGVYNKLKFFVEDQIYWSPASTTSDLYSQLASKKYREIPREQIKTVNLLGSGEFGNVYKAVWSISGVTKDVAAKTLKPGSSENDRVRFLQEAAIMGQFNHPHVVKLYGVITVGDPIMICTELMVNGDLRSYLGTVSPNKCGPKQLELQLLKFSRQIASGMAYLSKKAFVHRDLAARNILLDEPLNCKISDFGMARDLVDDTYYTVQSKGGKIPVKWTAPEALFYKKYSTDSDVWSYGMVLFEIWSVGKKPFSEISNTEIVRKINSGYCQPPPPGTPRPIYQLMVSCWNPIHSQRPSFPKISATLNASSNTLLQWTGDDHSTAGQLGGHISEARFLFQDLQNTYIS